MRCWRCGGRCRTAENRTADEREVAGVNTMTRMPHPLILRIRGHAPLLHAESWVAPNASVIGQVTLAARASVWYGATLRAEAEPIEIGFGTNIQDGVTIHVDSEFPVSIGAGVSVGRNAVLHGCVVEDDALIGIGGRYPQRRHHRRGLSGRGGRVGPTGRRGAATVPCDRRAGQCPP